MSEWELENVIYFGKPITGPELDMGFIYREIRLNPEGIQPIDTTGDANGR